MKNIAFLVYDITLTGGAERVAINMANALTSNYKVSVISFFKSKDVIGLEENVNVFFLNKSPISITKSFFKLSYKLKKILKTEKIDSLIAITAGVVTVAAFAIKGIETKLIYAEHSNLENQTYGKKHFLRQKLGAKNADIVVTLTNRDRNNFIRTFRIPDSKVVSIPNWYEEPQNKIHENKTGKYKKIISVGRLEYVKGYDFLLECAKNIQNELPGWTWDIYGDGSYHSVLQNMITIYKLDNFVRLMGNVRNVPYNEYDFLVMTSRYEGLPMSLLEAQSNNLPIISFDCATGPSEIIVNNKNGILIDCYNIDSLGRVIVTFANNTEKIRLFSENARINIHNFSKVTILKKWTDLIG